MKTLLRIVLNKMTSNSSDNIEYKRATEDTKREDTCIIILFYFVSAVSIRDYSQMAALKNIRKFDFLSTPVKLLSHLSLKKTLLNLHRCLIQARI